MAEHWADAEVNLMDARSMHSMCMEIAAPGNHSHSMTDSYNGARSDHICTLETYKYMPATQHVHLLLPPQWGFAQSTRSSMRMPQLATIKGTGHFPAS